MQNRRNRPAEAEADSSGFQCVAIRLMVALWVFKRTKNTLFILKKINEKFPLKLSGKAKHGHSLPTFKMLLQVLAWYGSAHLEI